MVLLHGILGTAFNTTSMITEVSFTMRNYGILGGLITVHLMKGLVSVDSSKPTNH